MNKSLVLVSGGMDSATALAIAVANGDETAALSLSYGNRHAVMEGKAARELATYYGVPLETKELDPGIFQGGNSALIGEQEVPSEEYHDPEKETPSVTVVPFRNANFIAVAVAMAEARGYDKVWISVHGTDHLGWAYPDCSPEFIGAMASAVYIGTMRKVRLIAPFLSMTKAEIVEKGMRLKVPYMFTYSCYRGGEVSCGVCPTCLERLNAFKLASAVDPINYVVRNV